MTIKQRILKAAYPLFLKLSKKTAFAVSNTQGKKPPVSFYSLKAKNSAGKEVSFEQYRGKKVMLVNVASNCGYTGQYDALEDLYKSHQDKLVLLGFPANDFGAQEPGTNSEIVEFCRVNYGVTFPLLQKSSVVKPEPNSVFQWLSDKDKNGWNSKVPTWNFCKYVVDENGVLTHFFNSAVTPDDKEVLEAVK